jgi:PIN domain nuclease of toxin-antitoxin system
MKILLDTHTFIWFTEGAPELSAKARSLIEDINNDSYVSIASLWEMSIKVGLGKLTLNVGTFDKVIDLINENGFQILGIDFLHTLENSKLLFHHRDPFDRIIIAQGIIENMNIIGIDGIFDDYLTDTSIKRLW